MLAAAPASVDGVLENGRAASPTPAPVLEHNGQYALDLEAAA